MGRHIRITLENSDGERFFCVLEEAADYTDQMEQVFDIRKGYGFSIRCLADRIELYDYFAAEVRATFRVVKESPTEEAVCYHLQKEEQEGAE